MKPAKQKDLSLKQRTLLLNQAENTYYHLVHTLAIVAEDYYYDADIVVDVAANSVYQLIHEMKRKIREEEAENKDRDMNYNA